MGVFQADYYDFRIFWCVFHEIRDFRQLTDVFHYKSILYNKIRWLTYKSTFPVEYFKNMATVCVNSRAGVGAWSMTAMCTERLTETLSLKRGSCGSSDVSSQPWPEANAGSDTYSRRKSVLRDRCQHRTVKKCVNAWETPVVSILPPSHYLWVHKSNQSVCPLCSVVTICGVRDVPVPRRESFLFFLRVTL